MRVGFDVDPGERLQGLALHCAHLDTEVVEDGGGVIDERSGGADLQSFGKRLALYHQEWVALVTVTTTMLSLPDHVLGRVGIKCVPGCAGYTKVVAGLITRKRDRDSTG